MQDKIELVNGKFVKKGEKEVLPSSPKKIKQKEYSEEVILLKERVVNGNQKLFNAWLKIKELDHGGEEWSKLMDKWNEAQQRLHLLCQELKYLGFDECLYLDINNKRTKHCLKNPDGFWCQVCPSTTRKYWEEELMNLPGPGSKK